MRCLPPTVDEYLRRAEAAGLSWPLPADLDDGALERLLFPAVPVLAPQLRGLPDWSRINQELKRKGVTLFLLWQEYREQYPQGYQYSWFCDHYRAWRGKLDVVMRQDHRAGEKLFIDYAGQTVPIVDRFTGEIREAQIFVAVLGASNYTFAEATWTQGLADWIGSHQRTFAFLGGVPELLVPDKLKSYGAAYRELGMGTVHEMDRYRNNRAENSHQPTRQKERQMRGFKSACHAQRLLSALGPIQDLFRHDRHLMSARSYRDLWKKGMVEWNGVAGIASAI